MVEGRKFPSAVCADTFRVHFVASNIFNFGFLEEFLDSYIVFNLKILERFKTLESAHLGHTSDQLFHQCFRGLHELQLQKI